MSSVHVKTTFVMKVMRICFVSFKNRKFFRILHSLKKKARVYLPVTNIMVAQSYYWYIPVNGNNIY